MDHSVTFARHYARLLWLLVHEPSNVDEQKASLRALVTISKDGAVSFATDGVELLANGNMVPAVLAGVSDVVRLLRAHGVEQVQFDAGAAAAGVIGSARVLAFNAAQDDGGQAAIAKQDALGAPSVRFIGTPVAAVAAPSAPPAAPVAPVDAPAAPTPSPAAPIHEAATLPDVGFGDVLDELVVIAEGAARDGKALLVSDILCRVTSREPAINEFEAKRAFVMALRRMAKPTLLRAVTQQIPHATDRRDELIAVLARAGEDGADALIEQIAAVSGQSDRRAYFDALVQLQAGLPTLVLMLGDARWFVARNAAELLGEMQAKEAEPKLTELLRHEDDRVRRAATGALMRLGTSRAMQAIQDALKDGAPAMRMQAAAALLTRKDVKTAATLVRALEDEKDDEVQAAFLLALGKLATPDAVQRLTKAVEAERGLFKKKSTAFRVAAVQGLAEARTPDAMDTLKALQADKDDDVKSAVTFALLRIAKQAPIPARPSA